MPNMFHRGPSTRQFIWQRTRRSFLKTVCVVCVCACNSSSDKNSNDRIVLCWVVTLIERIHRCALHTSRHSCIHNQAIWCGTKSSNDQHAASCFAAQLHRTNHHGDPFSFCFSNSEYDLNKLRKQNEWICIRRGSERVDGRTGNWVWLWASNFVCISFCSIAFNLNSPASEMNVNANEEKVDGNETRKKMNKI